MSTTSITKHPKFTGCEMGHVKTGYAGETRNNLREGYGTYTYPNSFFRFEGEWKEGVKDGFGKLKMRDGSFYEGEFVNGEICGTGMRLWSHNNNVYEGKFDQGEMNGMGVMKYGNGDVYQGQWADNKAEGEGVYNYANGDVYKGSFYRHKRHGDGTFVSSAESYDGGWIQNLKHGRGVMCFEDGSTYEGQWKSDMMNGQGILKHVSGLLYDGIWTNNRPLLEPSKILPENGDVITVEQSDVMFSLKINCVTDEGDVVTESGRLLRISAGIKCQEKTNNNNNNNNNLSTKNQPDDNNETTSQSEERRQTPFGFEVESYPICLKAPIPTSTKEGGEGLKEEDEGGVKGDEGDNITAVYHNERTSPLFEVQQTDGVVDPQNSPSPTSQDIPFEVCTIPLTRTEQGHVTLCDVILPSQPTTNVRQTNSGIASLSPDSVEGRKINRNRRLTEASATKLSATEGRNTTTANKLKNDLEKLAEEGGSGREGSGGIGAGTTSSRRKKNRNKQEDKFEEVVNENFCKAGDYVIIIEDVTESPYLGITMETTFVHVIVQPVLRKTKSRTDTKR